MSKVRAVLALLIAVGATSAACAQESYITPRETYIQPPYAILTVDPGRIERVPTGYEFSTPAFPTSELFVIPEDAGWNASTTTNDGRTGIARHFLEIHHRGQGDGGAFTVFARCWGKERGVPMANPACIIINGQAEAFADGVLLNPVEVHMHDHRRRNVSAVGLVVQDDVGGPRDPGYGTFRWGVRVQNVGPQSGDTAHTIYGKYASGIDLARLDSEDQAAMILRQGHRIYWSGQPGETVFHRSHHGQTWTEYWAPSQTLATTVDGVPAMYLNREWAALTGHVVVGGQMRLPAIHTGTTTRGGVRVCMDPDGWLYRERDGAC